MLNIGRPVVIAALLVTVGSTARASASDLRIVAAGRRAAVTVTIRERATGLEYVAKPSQQPETVFTSTHVSGTEVVFENRTHDFPKKIIYKRDGDALIASIEGPMNGQTRKINVPYKKVACGS